MSQKIKTTILIILGLIIVLFVLSLITAPKPETAQPQANNEPAAAPSQPIDTANGDLNVPPPPPVFQSSERRYVVLSAKENIKDTYQVRDLADNKEVDLFLPSDAIITAGKRANITAGTILTVQTFMELSNGVVATNLSISTKE